MIFPANSLKKSSTLLLMLPQAFLGLIFLFILFKTANLSWLFLLLSTSVWILLALGINRLFRRHLDKKRIDEVTSIWQQRVDASRLEKIIKDKRSETVLLAKEFVILQIETNELYKSKDPRITELSHYVLSEVLNKDFLPFLRKKGALVLEASSSSATLLFDQEFFHVPTTQTPLALTSDALIAFDCAAQIQNKLIKLNSDNRKKLMPIVPLSFHLSLHQLSIEYSAHQFSINTEKLQDYQTNIKPLTTSGENFLLMMTTGFVDRLGRPAQDLFYEKYLRTNIGSAFFKIYEYLDKSLQSEKDLLETTLNSFLHYRRKDERFNLNKQFAVSIRVLDLDASGQLLNFSKSGLMVQLDKCIGKACPLLLELNSESPSIREHFLKIGLQTLEAEVRYEMHNGKDQFIHGLKLVTNQLSQDQTLLFKALLPYKA